MSSSAPCAPSNITFSPLLIASFSSAAVSVTNGAICSAARAYSSYIAFASSGAVPNSAAAIVFFSWHAFSMCVRSSAEFSRSTTRSPLRCILSSYAGPIPRLVVPILVRPGAFSAANSIIRW